MVKNPQKMDWFIRAKSSRYNETAVGQYLDRMRQSFCTGWEKALGAAMAEDHQKRGSENVSAIGNWAAKGSGSEAEQLCHPQ